MKLLIWPPAAPFLNSGNSYLFFGNGSGSYGYTKATISGPASDSISTSDSARDADSGGSIGCAQPGAAAARWMRFSWHCSRNWHSQVRCVDAVGLTRRRFTPAR